MSQLAVMIFLYDHPELLIVSSSVLSYSGYHYAHRTGYAYRYPGDRHGSHGEDKSKYADNDVPEDIPGNFALHRLLQSGWVKHFPKLRKKTIERTKDFGWAWYDHPYEMTDEGRAVTEKHRHRYEEHLRKRAAARAEVERLVIVKNTSRYSDKRDCAALCRVVKETDKRLYVERVDTSDRWVPTIEGSRKNTYVAKTNVYMDGVTQEEWEVRRRVEDERLAWEKEVRAQMAEEIQAIKDRYKDRIDQGKYRFDDQIREELEKQK